MISYLIKKDSHEDSIYIFNDKINGYRFKPKSTVENNYKVKEITLVDVKLIDHVLTNKFLRSYNKLMVLVKDVLNDDSDDSDERAVQAIDEVERLIYILHHKYQEFLKKEKAEMFLKQLEMVKVELKKKIVINKINSIGGMVVNPEVEEERKGIRR